MPKPTPKAKRAAKKRPKPREGLDRPRCNGLWTESKFQNFIVSALRRASSRWAPKFECIKACYVGKGVNPATGHPCKLHKCPQCEGLFPQTFMRADHVVSVVGPEGFVDFNTFIARLFVEADGYSAVCFDCHEKFSAHERKLRAAHKASLP